MPIRVTQEVGRNDAMKIEIQRLEPVRVTFPVRANIRDEDIKRLQSERFDRRIEHIDLQVELGAEDFTSDDERLFAADFAETLRLEQVKRGRSNDGNGGLLVLNAVTYPLDTEQLANKVVAFLKDGVREEEARNRAMAELKARSLAAMQMVGPVVTRFVESNRELQTWSEQWSAQMKQASKKLDRQAYEALVEARRAKAAELKKAEETLLQKLARDLEVGLGELARGMTWSVASGLEIYRNEDASASERLQEGPLKAELSALVYCQSWINKISLRFEGQVWSRFFRKSGFNDEVELAAVEMLFAALRGVQEKKSGELFKQAAIRLQLEQQQKNRKLWIKKFGSAELKTALEQQMECMPLYAREVFRHLCASEADTLQGFAIDVDSNLFYSAYLRPHGDPSQEALRLIGAISTFVQGAACCRLEDRHASVKAVNNEVVMVPGASIGPGCHDLFLWRLAETKRPAARRS